MKHVRSTQTEFILALTLFGALATSCIPTAQPGMTRFSYQPTSGETVVKAKPTLDPTFPVFLASNRALRDEQQNRHPFADEPSSDFGLRFGVAQVEIENPTAHRRGRVSLKRTTLLASDPATRDSALADDWTDEIRAQLKHRTESTIVIYVHGYNAYVPANTEIAALLFHLCGQPGAVINFEWPSRESVLSYAADKALANISTRHFRTLLQQLSAETGADQIHLIGHSAGCPLIVRSLAAIRQANLNLTPDQLQDRFRIGRVVLAAPDIGAGIFFNEVLDGFHEVTEGVTVYASQGDLPLLASQLVFDEARLGRSFDGFDPWQSELALSLPEIEWIDVSGLESRRNGFLGHFHFLCNPTVSLDITRIVAGRSVEVRGLSKQDPNSLGFSLPSP
ncbi:MAG: alpha/beta fold hydrolase [Verrucomicrobiota bacterium]